MQTTINYSQSKAPNFDAIEDLKDWFGADRFSKLTQELSVIKDCKQFAMFCSLGGVQGFPVKAWYGLIHGQGSWRNCA